MLVFRRYAVALTLPLLAACGSGGAKDPVAEAKFQNEKRIGDEAVTEKQERDAEFLVTAATHLMQDSEMSQMAQRKATAPGAKQLAQLVISEHGSMQKALQTLAAQKSIVLPASLGADQGKRLGELGALNGPAFDRKFAELLEDSHKTTVDEFDDMSEDAYDGDIRAFAAKFLPTLKAHHAAADQLADQLGS